MSVCCFVEIIMMMMMMMTHCSCMEAMMDFLIEQALRLPSSSKVLKDFVHDECRTLLTEYGDSNPLVQESRSQSDKWEREFKTLQVALHHAYHPALQSMYI